VSRAPYDPGELSETASEIFRLLGERLGWEVGVLWAVEKDALRCGGIWRAEGRAPSGFEEACRGSDFRRGEGLPGRVWRLGEACWVEDVLEDEGFLSRGVAEGLRCALALPIQDGGRLFGVFELLKGEVTPVEDLLRAAYLSGNWIGQFVERRRVAGEGDVESSNDAFFAVDGAGRFTYVNRRATCATRSSWCCARPSATPCSTRAAARSPWASTSRRRA
jgi:GAF domain-containing protein